MEDLESEGLLDSKRRNVRWDDSHERAASETSNAAETFQPNFDRRRDNRHRRSLTSNYEDFSHSSSAVLLCVYHAAVYYLSAVLLFSFGVEKWPIIDSLYYGSVVFTTIGFGDLHPKEHAGRVATIILALYGIVILGLFLGIIGFHVISFYYTSVEADRRRVSEFAVRVLSNEAEQGLQQKATSETQTTNDVKERRLLDEIIEICLLEAPVVAIVVILAMVVGHIEGWSIFGRYVIRCVLCGTI